MIKSKEALDRISRGTCEFQAGVDASAGTAAEGSSGGSSEGFTVHVLSDDGATATARVVCIKVNKNLSKKY